MLIVADDAVRIEAQLCAGELRCPECEGRLRPWGHARRRWLRTLTGRREIRPRRSACDGCGRTHVLLPGVTLLRRADTVEVIGSALVAADSGDSHRTIASRLARPPATVRGWLRRFEARAPHTIAHALATVYRLNVDVVRIEPPADASPTRTALHLLALAAHTAQRNVGRQARCRWQVISSLCQGRLLANTSCPYPALP